MPCMSYLTCPLIQTDKQSVEYLGNMQSILGASEVSRLTFPSLHTQASVQYWGYCVLAVMQWSSLIKLC